MTRGHWAIVHEVAMLEHGFEPGLEYIALHSGHNSTSVHDVGENTLIVSCTAQTDGEVNVHFESTGKELFGCHVQAKRIVHDAHGEVVEIFRAILAFSRLEYNARLCNE